MVLRDFSRVPTTGVNIHIGELARVVKYELREWIPLDSTPNDELPNILILHLG